MIKPDDHPISNFNDQFIINLQKEMTVADNLTNLYERHRQIWNNESYRKLVIDIVVRTGTNCLLVDKPKMSWAMYAAQAIVVLENYNGTDDIDSVINSRVVVSKWENLRVSGSSERRDCLKFYRKRIACKCLKKLHLEARKTIPKLGVCEHCEQEKERASLSVCSRCMMDQYCSKECQIADWPGHEMICDKYVSAACKNDMEE